LISVNLKLSESVKFSKKGGIYSVYIFSTNNMEVNIAAAMYCYFGTHTLSIH